MDIITYALLKKKIDSITPAEDIVTSGYYNPNDGKFYKNYDSSTQTYSDPFTPKENCIYIDLLTNSEYFYNNNQYQNLSPQYNFMKDNAVKNVKVHNGVLSFEQELYLADYSILPYYEFNLSGSEPLVSVRPAAHAGDSMSVTYWLEYDIFKKEEVNVLNLMNMSTSEAIPYTIQEHSNNIQSVVFTMPDANVFMEGAIQNKNMTRAILYEGDFLPPLIISAQSGSSVVLKYDAITGLEFDARIEAQDDNGNIVLIPCEISYDTQAAVYSVEFIMPYASITVITPSLHKQPILFNNNTGLELVENIPLEGVVNQNVFCECVSETEDLSIYEFKVKKLNTEEAIEITHIDKGDSKHIAMEFLMPDTPVVITLGLPEATPDGPQIDPIFP